ncbi:CRAL/TRIO domain-containing protein [Linderina pennispora]|uniref:CRAL/TRIO domain-containing protein n=1 Tax=Linderina pennispora TaxID=61395 RepID=A0A1Y1WCE4_9FUNG|nr:CRAL/TRIO domain-containing protein [Linderina pennispora]ORX70824.1 CRAL/TRIO domain-containing protein [Linderina pennispora]
MAGDYPILNNYKTGAPVTDGKVGHLTASQEQKLKQMWAKILNYFVDHKDKPIAVPADPFKAGDLAELDDTPAAVSQWYSANKTRIDNVKYKTVNDALYLSGKTSAVVPRDFRPLFGDRPGSRSFRNAFWQAAMSHQHPDSFPLAFLIAREWDVDRAFQLLVGAVEWRATHAMDKLVWQGEATMNMRMMERGLTYVPGKDKLGCPLLVVRVHENIPREHGEGFGEKYTAFAMEQASLITRANGERATLVYDMSSFKMENIDYGFVKTIITMNNTIYPETFQLIIVYVNSWLFSGIWKLISPWFDPIIAKRIVFAKNVQQLQAYIDIGQIPEEMGGKKKFKREHPMPTRKENEPMFDAAARDAAEKNFVAAVDAFEASTGGWIKDNEEPLRGEVADTFKKSVAELDPYIRARFLAERKGEMTAEGCLVV